MHIKAFGRKITGKQIKIPILVAQSLWLLNPAHG
jgi:hypothetical protein